MKFHSRVVRFIHPHRRDSWFLLGFLLLTGILFGLIKLASEVAEGDTFALDKAIIFGLREATDTSIPIGPVWLKIAMVDLTALGSTAVLTVVTLLAVGYLIAKKKFWTATFVAISIGIGASLSVLIKALFVRPRPEIVPHLVEVTSASFPSGHAMNSAIVYLTLAVLVARAERGGRMQLYLIMTASFLTLLVGCSRVYLGVHWPSDVLAGWIIGAGWAALSSLLAKYFQVRYKIERPVVTLK